MSILIFVPLVILAALTECTPDQYARRAAHRAAIVTKIKKGVNDAMLTILCLVLFPVVALAELLKISK